MSLDCLPTLEEAPCNGHVPFPLDCLPTLGEALHSQCEVLQLDRKVSCLQPQVAV